MEAPSKLLDCLRMPFHEYVQYESVQHVHTGPDRSWSHEGTNGFTSRMYASG